MAGRRRTLRRPSGHELVGAAAVLKSAADLDKDFVSDLVTEGVVHRLEVIQVKDHHRKPTRVSSPIMAADGAVHLLIEGSAG